VAIVSNGGLTDIAIPGDGSVNELFGISDIPLLVRRGGRDIKKNGAKQPYLERTGWSPTSRVAL